MLQDEIPLLQNNTSQSLPQLDPLFDMLDLAVCIIDWDGKFTAANSEFCKMSGADNQTLIRKKIGDFFLSESDQSILEIIQKYQKINGRPLSDEKIKHKVRSNLQLSLSSKILIHSNQKTYFIISIKEIILTEEAQGKIDELEETLDAISNKTENGFIILDERHNIKFFNEKARENIFLLNDVKKGNSIYQFIENKNLDQFKNQIENTFKGQSYQFEHLKNDKTNNEPRWMELSITPIKRDGLVKSICIRATNITQQKSALTKLNHTKDLFNSAEEIANIGVGEINFITNVRTWSDGFYRILGLNPENITPKSKDFIQYIHPDEKEKFQKWFLSIIEDRKDSQHIETQIITATGEFRYIRASRSASYFADGKLSVLFGVMQDITERKILELQLKESREMYQSLFYQNPSAVFSLDMDGNFTSANHIFAIKAECTEEEIMKLKYLDFVDDDDVEATKVHFKNTIQGQHQSYSIKIVSAKGQKLIAAIISLPIIINNEITGIFCLANDITSEINEKILFDKTLSDRQRILDNSLDVICEIDRHGRFTQVSKACTHLFGYSEEEMVGRKYIDMVFEADLEKTIKMAAIIESGGPVTRNFENRYKRKDGSVIDVLWSVGWDEKEKIMYCTVKDATEKKEQQQALVLSEQRYKDLFNHNPLPLYIFNFSTLFIVEVNDAAIKKYGYSREEFLFLTVSDFCIPEELPLFEKMLKNLKSLTMMGKKSWGHVKKNGEIMHLNISGNIIDYNGKKSVLTLLDDVTDKIKIAEQREFERINKEALINATNDDIWSITKEFKLIAGNKAFLKKVKIHYGVTIAPGDNVLASPQLMKEEKDIWQDLYIRALKGKPFKKELIIEEALTNVKRWIEITFNPIFNGKIITGIACYSRNITESKLYHIKLLQINIQLEMAQKMAKLGNYEFDITATNTFWSKEMSNIFGIKNIKTGVSYLQLIEAIHPEDRQRVILNYTLAIEKKQQLNIEHRIVLPDGSIKFLVQKGSLRYNDLGKVIAFRGTSQDITQRKLAEQAVKDSEEKYKQIFESNPLPNWIYDLSSFEILKANNAASTYYGYENNEFLKMLITDIFINKEAERDFKIDVKTKDAGIINFGQWQHVTKNGKIINVIINGHSIVYNDKNAVMVVANDITEMVQSQQALAKSNERFDYATKATFDAIWEIDILNDTMFWGEGFNTLFGYNLKESEKNSPGQGTFIHPQDRERVLKSLEEVVKDRHKIYWTNQYQFLKKNGAYATVVDSALVVRDLAGIPYRIIGAMKDITDRIKSESIQKELNGQLNIRAAQLASSNAELEQFAYIASHDLQEPLRMVTGFLKRIQKKYEFELDETGRSYINFAVDGAVRMRQIILDLLEYSRIGKQQYQYEKIDTNKLMDEVCNIYTNIQQPEKIEIKYANLPEIFAARTPLHQLFQNLISNAVKYHKDKTPIKIVITGEEKTDHWYFSIKDNGIGISIENFNKIFVLFRRLHNKDEYSGTGIGLAICKKIIDNHKGKLWVNSEPGKGSTFYFTISKTIL